MIELHIKTTTCHDRKATAQLFCVCVCVFYPAGSFGGMGAFCFKIEKTSLTQHYY